MRPALPRDQTDQPTTNIYGASAFLDRFTSQFGKPIRGIVSGELLAIARSVRCGSSITCCISGIHKVTILEFVLLRV